MPDYKAMYFHLFNMITDAVGLLQQAQIDGEDAFISNKDTPPIELLGGQKQHEKEAN